MGILRAGQKVGLSLQIASLANKKPEEVQIKLHSCVFGAGYWWAIISVEYSAEIHLYTGFQLCKLHSHLNATDEPPPFSQSWTDFSILAPDPVHHQFIGVRFKTADDQSQWTLLTITGTKGDDHNAIRFTRITENGLEYTFDPEEVFIS